MKAVIFAGGTGTRLWPMSRTKSPKQFRNFIDEKTMFQLAVDRLVPEFSFTDIYVATGLAYKDDLVSQVPDLIEENVILEPVVRDVGPAVGLIASIFAKHSPDEPLAILWGGDHLVRDEAKYRSMLFAGEEYIKKNPEKIVFFGQKPRFATTNLGWITIGDQLESIRGIDSYSFKGWKYRPDPETANSYFASKNHVWNPGYFLVTASHLWHLFELHAPSLFKKLQMIQASLDTPDYNAVLNEIYPTLQRVSFDNAVIEHVDTHDAIVLVDDFGWSDVGAWEQLKEALQDSRNANVTRGNVMLKDSQDTLVFNYEDEKTIVGIDLNDFVVVNTPDVILVTKKTSVSKIKTLVESLKGTEHEKLI